MQIHEAANLYPTHRAELDSYNCKDDVWRISYRYVDSGANKAYVLTLHGGADHNPVIRDHASPRFENDRYITKQRGGIRYFRSLNAVLNALLQIGQTKLDISELMECKK